MVVLNQRLLNIYQDHDKTLFEGRKQLMLDLVNTLNKKFGEDTFSIVIKDQY